MKRKTLFSLAMFLSVFIPARSFSQDTLPTVTVFSRNYKYLKTVDNKESSQPVRLLEHIAAAYNIQESNIYNEQYDMYYVSFYLPDGYILAAYDQDGKIIYTAEHFQDVNLPTIVKDAVFKQYPNWAILKDVYIVRYKDQNSPAIVYKITLAARDRRVKIKVDEKGHID